MNKRGPPIRSMLKRLSAYFAPERGVNHCDEYMSVCLSVYLSVFCLTTRITYTSQTNNGCMSNLY